MGSSARFSLTFIKFACIVKQRTDGTVKRRFIMDSKRSSVTAASRKTYKAILPRATDLVTDVLSLKSEASPDDGIDLLVLDPMTKLVCVDLVTQILGGNQTERACAQGGEASR